MRDLCSTLYIMLCCRAYHASRRLLSRSSHHRHGGVPISSSKPARQYDIRRQPTLRRFCIAGATTYLRSSAQLGSPSRQLSHNYATLTELPPRTSTSIPAPPSLPNSESPQDETSNRAIQDDTMFRAASTASKPSEPSDDVFGELYSIANSPSHYQIFNVFDDTSAEAYYLPDEAVKSALSTNEAVSKVQTTLKLRPKAKPASRRSKHSTFITKSLSPKEAIKPISEQSFESFRLQHRKAQYRLDYTWEGTESCESPGQPHHQSLASRYDWRLRTPWRTPNQVQKHAYGSKILFRKRPQADDALESPELTSYQEKYRRFIALEREESERLALNRLRQNGKREANPFTAAPLGPAEHLAGLQVVPGIRRRQFQVARESAEQATEEDILQAETMTESNYDSDNRKLFLFSRPDRQELPSNTFHRGKMVFIWKCQYDSFLQEWIVPELQNTSMTLEQLSAIPARGYVHREWSNQIDILCENFVPQPGEAYRSVIW